MGGEIGHKGVETKLCAWPGCELQAAIKNNLEDHCDEHPLEVSRKMMEFVPAEMENSK